MRPALAAIGFLFISTVAFSATIYVPDNYPTIQDAINASANGDTVIVRPGTYVENIDFVGKAITVQSEQGATVTTIDGNQAGSVVIFQSGEGPASVLEEFTLANGTGTLNGTDLIGGGICCIGASPTIKGNIIKDNVVNSPVYQSLGGGICCKGSSPAIERNIITGNLSQIFGGGISCYQNSSPAILNNTISDNNCYYGGGISCYVDSSPVVTNNIISGHTGGIMGGGISCYQDSSPTITNNTITGNSAHSGGGINCYISSSPVITANIITWNSSGSYGGGISSMHSSSPYISSNLIMWNDVYGNWGGSGGGIFCESATIANNIIMGNVADASYFDGGGGGIACQDTVIITNNTIFENKADIGGGIGCFDASLTISNTILWKNTAPKGKEIYLGTTFIPTTLLISYSDVHGGAASVQVEPGCSVVCGLGLIDADPLFADPTNNDFHLTWPSPCRNTGDNIAVTELYDFEGDPRIVGTVDMGADEFYYHLYSVGDVLPGSPIDLKVVGAPGFPTLLALGTGIQDPPQSTPHGDLWLTMPLAKSWQLGQIPGDGILVFPATIPSGWPSGSTHPFQALVGPWGGGATRLTNLMTLTVE
jgi:hypothetical protein